MVIITTWVFSSIITVGTFLSLLVYEYEPKSGVWFLKMKNFVTSFMAVENTSYSAMLNIAEPVPPPESVPTDSLEFQGVPESEGIQMQDEE
jgi:hypothetical protein